MKQDILNKIYIKHYCYYLLFLLLYSNSYADEISAHEIVSKMVSVMHPGASRGKIMQEIISSEDIKREFYLNYFSSIKSESIIIRYTHPEDIHNNAFLVKNYGKEVWVYFPKFGKIRKLASHARNEKAHGSDFTYTDFSNSGNWEKQYSPKKVFSGERRNYLLHLTPRNDLSVDYDSLKIYVHKLNYYPKEIQYFKNGKHIKSLRFKDINIIQGFPTAIIMEMKNYVENSQTTLRILEMEYNVEYEDGFFNQRSLLYSP